MCQILFSKSANPPKAAIVDANAMNKDGFGFAWRTADNKVKWQKGYSDTELSESLIQEYLDLPFPKAIHFRLATHGGTTQELTHPFPIKRGNPHDLAGSAPAVLFHNGVWNSYDDRLREAILSGGINPNVLKGGMSDSRAMAVLAQRYGLDFLDYLGLGSNKVLILMQDDYIVYGSWTEKEGWSASNSRIFREEHKPRHVHSHGERGVSLGPSGLPIVGVPVEPVKPGHLNRHGNVRRKFRRGQGDPGVGGVGEEARGVDAGRGTVDGLSEHSRTDQPSSSSMYLSANAEQLSLAQQDWGMRERLVH